MLKILLNQCQGFKMRSVVTKAEQHAVSVSPLSTLFTTVTEEAIEFYMHRFVEKALTAPSLVPVR